MTQFQWELEAPKSSLLSTRYAIGFKIRSCRVLDIRSYTLQRYVNIFVIYPKIDRRVITDPKSSAYSSRKILYNCNDFVNSFLNNYLKHNKEAFYSCSQPPFKYLRFNFWFIIQIAETFFYIFTFKEAIARHCLLKLQ